MGLPRRMYIEQLKSSYHAHLNVHKNDQTTNKKVRINILNAILLSELILLNCSEISTYEKMHYELKSVQNVLGILLKTILKTKNNRFYKNSYSKSCIILHVCDTLFWYFWRKDKY